jgi:hypothetical protein
MVDMLIFKKISRTYGGVQDGKSYVTTMTQVVL